MLHDGTTCITSEGWYPGCPGRCALAGHPEHEARLDDQSARILIHEASRSGIPLARRRPPPTAGQRVLRTRGWERIAWRSSVEERFSFVVPSGRPRRPSSRRSPGCRALATTGAEEAPAAGDTAPALADDLPVTSEPVIAHVTDLRAGQLSVFVGEREYAVVDRSLASRLLQVTK